MVLEVSRTACYRYLRGGAYQATPKRAAHRQLVEQVFRAHKRQYSNQRITAELQEKGCVLVVTKYELHKMPVVNLG